MPPKLEGVVSMSDSRISLNQKIELLKMFVVQSKKNYSLAAEQAPKNHPDSARMAG